MLADNVRTLFDATFEDVLAHLPPAIRQIIELVPVILEDQPSDEILAELDVPPDGISGLHSGIPLTEQSVEGGSVLPETIHLYRRGILATAASVEDLREEIRITLLHEMGHHFGLDENALEELGYG